MSDQDEAVPASARAAYAEDCRRLLARARAAAANGRWDAPAVEIFRLAAHRLAGSAGLYGFGRAGELAASLEADLAAGGCGRERASARLDEVAAALGLEE